MVLEVVLGMLIEMRRVEQSLGGNAADVETSATKSATALDTGSLGRDVRRQSAEEGRKEEDSHLQTQLSSLNGSDVATGAATNHDHVILRCSGEGADAKERMAGDLVRGVQDTS